MDRLQALRYDPGREGSRPGALQELAEAMGALLGAVPGLLADLCTDGGKRLTHVKLIFSSQELSLLPFELARSPRGFPGEGRPLFLQADGPLSISRQTRCAQRGTDWRATPKILFAWSGVEPELVKAHLQALRLALAPQLRDERKHLRDHITVLEQATWQDIEQACRRTSFTHVHLLAHGVVVRDSGDERFGLALSAARGAGGSIDRVSADRLACALRIPASGGSRSQPIVVSIAACDSGQQRAVLLPGGSLAHTLHEEGVPLVVASQFPLTYEGSVRMTEILYAGLLRGDDPRAVLHAVRCALAGTTHRNHDWASLLAYLAVPDDLEEQLLHVRYEAAQRTTTAAMDRARGPIEEPPADPDEAKAAFELGIEGLDHAIQPLEALARSAPRSEAAMRDVVRSFNFIGAARKRMAEFLHMRATRVAAEATGRSKREHECLVAAHDAYRAALGRAPRGTESWRAGYNTLALGRVLGDPLAYELWCTVHYGLGQDHHATAVDTAWNLSTRIVIDLLALGETALVTFVSSRSPGYSPAASARAAAQELARRCGFRDAEHRSTRRELERYVEWWRRPLGDERARLAKELLESLVPPEETPAPPPAAEPEQPRTVSRRRRRPRGE
ncbi:MAG: CHAT domain-containing protein [Planctomycetes bacterium]|nr:CHAT domain-containing protein [Planctomycetota bacterium]